MRYSALAGAAVTLVVAFGASPLGAQDAPDGDAPDAVVTEETAAVAADADALLGEEELDGLVAPVALYPDSLLTQVLVASTYPLDIIKADRFVTAEKDLPDKERAAKAEAEDWDPSVQVLAGAFPTVVQKMATEIDWTEQLGDAMLAQTDDVLDAVQRQRARAAAVGNLETNDAQVVEQTDDNISIAPAEPDVVYVPQYDATTAYTTPYTTAPVIDTGLSTSDVLTTGAIAFGSALLINEIFDDDDDWDDYWRPGYNHIDWDEGDLRPNRDIDVNGDVTIDRSRDRTTVIGGDRTNIDRERIGDAVGERGGAGKWEPSAEKQADARARLAERQGKEGGATAAAARDKIAARGGASGVSKSDISAKLSERKEPASLKPKDSAFKPKNLDAKKTREAANRGNLSKNQGKAKQAIKTNPQAVSRAKAAHKPARKTGAKGSALKKGNGGHVKAAKARGGHSHGGGGRRR